MRCHRQGHEQRICRHGVRAGRCRSGITDLGYGERHVSIMPRDAFSTASAVCLSEPVIPCVILPTTALPVARTHGLICIVKQRLLCVVAAEVRNRGGRRLNHSRLPVHTVLIRCSCVLDSTIECECTWQVHAPTLQPRCIGPASNQLHLLQRRGRRRPCHSERVR